MRATYYRNDAVRPMSDLDIAVQPRDTQAAIAALLRMGWTRIGTADDEDLRYRHSMQFLDPAKREIDLHWHLLREACSESATALFWSRAQPLVWAGVATSQLSAEDMLFHTLIHGVRANRMPPLRWVADAMTIIGAAGADFDWGRLLHLAAMLRLNQRLALGLGYLAERFAAPIPEETLRTLRLRRPSWVERVENSVVLRDADRLFDRLLTKPWVMFAEYARLATTTNPVLIFNEYTHYVRYRLRARGRLRLAAELARVISRRFIGALVSRR